MSITKLDEFPIVIILEICVYLDLRSLVALADISRNLRSTSHSYKSYWLPSAFQSGLLLPLPSRPWVTFSPPELSIAIRRALFRENNLSRDRPVLYSHTMISWPYFGLKLSAEGAEIPLGSDLAEQYPQDVCPGALFHDNGEWLFMISNNFVLRVLNMRTGILVLEERLSDADEATMSQFSGSWTLDSINDSEARYFTTTPYPTGQRNIDSKGKITFRALLQTFHIIFDKKSVSASITPLGSIPLSILPRRFDIAGDYAVIVEDIETSESDWSGAGPLHVLDWRTGQRACLPPLLDSISHCCCPEYFMSLGITTDNSAELQLVSLPPSKVAENTHSHNHDSYSVEDSLFTLAFSIPLRADSDKSPLDLSHEYTTIQHQYSGRTLGVIRVWIRDDFFSGSYSVFIVPVDLRGSAREWYAPARPIEHKRFAERSTIESILAPGTCGRRFFWWGEEVGSRRSQFLDTGHTGAHTQFKIFSSDIDDSLPLPAHMGEPEPETNDAQLRPYINDFGVYEEPVYFIKKYEAAMSYPTRQMECPVAIPFLNGKGPSIESLVTDEWSGTVMLVLNSGDLIILRYGHF